MSEAFVEHSNDMDDIYENIDEYYPNEKCRVLILLDDIIADILNNKRLGA